MFQGLRDTIRSMCSKQCNISANSIIFSSRILDTASTKGNNPIGLKNIFPPDTDERISAAAVLGDALLINSLNSGNTFRIKSQNSNRKFSKASITSSLGLNFKYSFNWDWVYLLSFLIEINVLNKVMWHAYNVIRDVKAILSLAGIALLLVAFILLPVNKG